MRAIRHRMRRLAEDIMLVKNIPPTSLLRLLAWYLRLKNSAKVKVGTCELTLNKAVNRAEGLWWVKVLVRALHQGFDVRLSSTNIKFYVDQVLFEEPLNYYGFLVLRHVIALHQHGAKFRDNMVILPEGVVLKYPRQDPFSLGVIEEVFVSQCWNFLNVSGRTVIDVGAYIGDSPIYFASKGANKVICFEPNPHSYQYLVENVKLNRYEGKIIPLNYAVAPKKSYIRLVVPNNNLLASTKVEYLPNETRYSGIKAVELPLEGDVLKMDCEGCEYDILMNLDPKKLPFSEIGLEYHGSVKSLLKYFKKGGYKTKIIQKKSENMGILYAFR